MCKILIMSGLDPKKKELNCQFMVEMGAVMSAGNTDGLGYTAVNKEGNIFGERWLFNHEAFDIRKETHTKPVKSSKLTKLKSLLGDFVELEDDASKTVPVRKYGSFGEVTDEIVACTLHTRMATNTVCFENIHPFVDMDRSVSVIHNGVIRNHEKADEIRSTCDSERILNQYIKNKMDVEPEHIQELIDGLKGYFACGIFAKDEEGRRVLDIFRTRASLGAAFVKELDAVVFSTDIDDVKKVCKFLGWTIVSKAKQVKEDTFMRVNAVTGEQLKVVKYRDTTLQSSYTNTGYSNYHGDHEWDSATEKWKKEQAERRKAAEEAMKKDSNNVINLPAKPEVVADVKLTEEQKQEEADLLAAGLTQQEIEEHRSRTTPTQAEIEVTKEIINKNDPLNESSAALDGYQFNKPQGLWMKRTNKLN